MPFWKEHIRSSISFDFLIALDTNFDLFFSSKAILYSFPFSVSLTYLFAFSSIDGTAPILYTTSWMAPTFSLILSWPSHKTSGLFTLGSGVCTCPLELPSWYHLLCPSVSSLSSSSPYSSGDCGLHLMLLLTQYFHHCLIFHLQTSSIHQSTSAHILQM